MATLDQDLERRLRRVPCDLRDEFPQVPLADIERDVDSTTRDLIKTAHFTDFLPVLVHRAVRERLRQAA